MKRYEVRGMMEWHPMFAAGKARIQVSFTGGHLGEGCVTPARYETSDPVVQKVIENSSAFKSGRIRLAFAKTEKVSSVAAPRPTNNVASHHVSVCDVPNAGINVVKDDKPPVLRKKLETFEFEDIDAAREFLAGPKRVPKSRLFDKSDILREAHILGFDISLKKE